jgi:hypothetical protein
MDAYYFCFAESIVNLYVNRDDKATASIIYHLAFICGQIVTPDILSDKNAEKLLTIIANHFGALPSWKPNYGDTEINEMLSRLDAMPAEGVRDIVSKMWAAVDPLK